MKFIIIILFLTLLPTSMVPQKITQSNEKKDPLIGMKLPVFFDNTIDGKAVNSIKDFQNRVVVVNFTMISSKGCLTEIKAWNQLYTKYKNNPNFAFISISADCPGAIKDYLANDNSKAAAQLRKAQNSEKMKYPIIAKCKECETHYNKQNTPIIKGINCKNIFDLFAVKSYPASYFIDKKGIIRYAEYGFTLEEKYFELNKSDLEKHIIELLNEK